MCGTRRRVTVYQTRVDASLLQRVSYYTGTPLYVQRAWSFEVSRLSWKFRFGIKRPCSAPTLARRASLNFCQVVTYSLLCEYISPASVWSSLSLSLFLSLCTETSNFLNVSRRKVASETFESDTRTREYSSGTRSRLTSHYARIVCEQIPPFSLLFICPRNQWNRISSVPPKQTSFSY